MEERGQVPMVNLGAGGDTAHLFAKTGDGIDDQGNKHGDDGSSSPGKK